MKIIIFIIDGLGDRPNEKGETPLKIAKKPTMNRIAEEGICGLMNAIDIGIRPGSDTAHLAILGYDPYKVYTGRGPLEAFGLGLDLKEGDIAFRCNFATVDDNFIVKDRRAGRLDFETAKILEKEIDGLEIDGVKVIFRSKGYRGALVLRGEGLDYMVTDADPHKDNVKVEEVKPLRKEAEKTAEILNKLLKIIYNKLKDHPVNIEREKKGLPPANIILPRGAGIVPKVEKFYEKYKMKGAVICGTALIKGIGKMLGLDVIEVEGANGTPNSNIMGKAKALLNNLDKYDFFLINVKAADEAGHDGKFELKKEIIEKIDNMLSYIFENINKDSVYFVLTGDHSTPIEVKDHSADPVPIVIWGKSVRKDDVKEFDEFACAKGGLHWIKGEHVMRILLDLTNRNEKFGA
ncbi:cofactor-independent phosphoglycerate mutase [Methanocaldococcus villosus KIN24-T80]|uniref:2,3-bisphosphoglycerate-independent phosphoglycerate mutase n=1 Tax=Methanocaldococcus villosus KIN24-T80 TaxID=1069083 RepID=N6VSF1_9EURY|nr:2,3-bisphosphoglycerate-independent phosphoglycerate mutase [Methanocaldococcus villosus]ENN96071.1 cofactor-independent phosphoglycerate mutase [Methanocaldococcus villosus KIN24-T80]